MIGTKLIIQRIISYIILLALVIIIAVTPNLIGMGYQTDKVLHTFTFCIITIFLTWRHSNKKRLALYAGSLLTLGVAIEIIQSFTVDRHAEWGDLLANIMGISLGLLIRYLLQSGYYASQKSTSILRN